MSSGERRPREEAQETIYQLEKLVDIYTCCHFWLPAGSFRRERPTIGDIEIVALPKIKTIPGEKNLLGDEGPATQQNKLLARLDYLLEAGAFEKQIKTDGSTRWGSKYRAITFKGWVFEIFLTDEQNYGIISLIRTGSAEFSESVVTRIKQRGEFRVAGGYLRPWFDGEPTEARLRDMPIIPCAKEEDLFHAAGLDWRWPKDREGRV